MTAPFFSILVPVYNHEKFVGLALDSLIAQTDPDWEACVVDDGSTDGTSAIVDGYARRDSRIRVFHKPNGGEASALNAAWQQARGTWINWLSSDDLYLPQKLAIQREWTLNHPSCRYFFTDFQTLDHSTGVVKPGYVAHTPTQGRELIELLGMNYVNGIAMCVHREVFETVGAFDEASKHGQDYDFHLKAISRFPPLRIPEVTCIQRMHPGQLSQQRAQAMFCDCAASALRFLNKSGPDAVMGPCHGHPVTELASKLEAALSVAVSPNSFHNLMGPHPAMIMHLATWVARAVAADTSCRPLVDLMGRTARTFAWKAMSEPDAAMWQTLSVICDLSALPATMSPVRVEDVTDMAYIRAVSQGDGQRAASLADYAASRQKRQISRLADGSLTLSGTVFWIPLLGPEIPSEVDVERVADVLVEKGASVVVLQAGVPHWVWRRGVMSLDLPSPARAMMALAAAPGNTVVVVFPGQRQSWWWDQVWPVMAPGDVAAEKLPAGNATGGTPRGRSRLLATAFRYAGQGMRLLKRKTL